jgi:hypothetical protein
MDIDCKTDKVLKNGQFIKINKAKRAVCGKVEILFLFETPPKK